MNPPQPKPEPAVIDAGEIDDGVVNGGELDDVQPTAPAPEPDKAREAVLYVTTANGNDEKVGKAIGESLRKYVPESIREAGKRKLVALNTALKNENYRPTSSEGKALELAGQRVNQASMSPEQAAEDRKLQQERWDRWAQMDAAAKAQKEAEDKLKWLQSPEGRAWAASKDTAEIDYSTEQKAIQRLRNALGSRGIK